jgi:hypothetical protein
MEVIFPAKRAPVMAFHGIVKLTGKRSSHFH